MSEITDCTLATFHVYTGCPHHMSSHVRTTLVHTTLGRYCFRTPSRPPSISHGRTPGRVAALSCPCPAGCWLRPVHCLVIWVWCHGQHPTECILLGVWVLAVWVFGCYNGCVPCSVVCHQERWIHVKQSCLGVFSCRFPFSGDVCFAAGSHLCPVDCGRVWFQGYHDGSKNGGKRATIWWVE